MLSRLTIPDNIKYIDMVVSFIVVLCNKAGFDTIEVNQINMAVEETLVYIMKNLFEAEGENNIDIICKEIPSGIKIIIKEKGLPIVTDFTPYYTVGKSLEDTHTEGLELFLVSKSLDKFSIHNLGREGREWCLTKSIKKERIDSCFPDVKNETQKQNIKKIVDFKYTVRDFQPEDAISISKCAYKAYGYTYENYIYYPEQIVELNRQGILISSVAVAEDGEIFGHIAFKYSSAEEQVPELGVAFVAPSHRGSRALRPLTTFMIDKAKKMNIMGFYVRAVTNHIVSQKTGESCGMKPCGMLLGCFPDDVKFKDLTGKVSQKESGVIIYLPLKEYIKVTVYPPEKHRKKIEEIYKHLAINREILVVDTDGKENQCLNMSFFKDEILNTGIINVFSYGENTFQEVKNTLNRYCLEKTDVIYIYLNLENPFASVFSIELEKLGFFFAGILPGFLSGHDAFVMQYLNNLKINYEEIKLNSQFSYEILQYVRENDPSVFRHGSTL